jgi:Uri superfamily endonuclease
VAAKRPDVSYRLHIGLARPLRLRIGRLGTFDFPAGTYVYTGSARAAMDARIARHLSATKTLRWHVDYLLAADGVRVLRVERSAVAECALNRSTPGAIVAPGFGSSDCRAGCGSHLKFAGPAAPAGRPARARQ